MRVINYNSCVLPKPEKQKIANSFSTTGFKAEQEMLSYSKNAVPNFCGLLGFLKKKKPLDFIPLSQDQFRSLITKYEDDLSKTACEEKVVTFIDFNQWIKGLSEYLSADIPKTIKTLVKSCINDENRRGAGVEHIVYNIPGCSKFVIRTPKWQAELSGEFAEIKDKFPDLNLGQPIARIGENIEILKKQAGIQGGVPGQFIRSAYGADFYLAHLMTVANMPQSAFDEFAHTLKVLYERNLSFDAVNPNNILIDTAKGKFNLVDDLVPSDKFAAYAGRTPLEHMLCGLMDFADARAFYWDDFFICKNEGYTIKKPEINSYCSEILDKCLKSAKKAGLPIPESMVRLEDAFELAGRELKSLQDIYSGI